MADQTITIGPRPSRWSTAWRDVATALLTITVLVLVHQLGDLRNQLDKASAQRGQEQQATVDAINTLRGQLSVKDARIKQLTDQLLAAGLHPVPAPTPSRASLPPERFVPGGEPTPVAAPHLSPTSKPKGKPSPKPTKSPKPKPSPGPVPPLPVPTITPLPGPVALTAVTAFRGNHDSNSSQRRASRRVTERGAGKPAWFERLQVHGLVRSHRPLVRDLLELDLVEPRPQVR